jgi:hypothetical protein
MESHTINTNKMKKTALILILVYAFFLNGFSQNVDDALRYSQVFYSGTARFMSMGGAFTALGGDLSAISLNPAGAGVFRSFEFSLTPQLYYNNTSSTFNNSKTSDFRYATNLNQLGFVANIISSGNETGLVNLNFAYSFNRTNNFNENITINGVSNNSSMADYFASQANGSTKNELFGSAWLANQTWLIDTLSGSSSKYGTIFSQYGDNTSSTYGQTIRRVITDDGYTGEHSFSIGANYSNKYFFGATLGISTLNYTGHIEHLESDDDNVIYDFKNFTYTDHLNATGTGYSLKIGTIIKPVDFLRIGLALHTPIVYRINENYYDNITSNFDIVVDGITNYEASNNTMRYKYTLTTPMRALAGVAFQIRKVAIISVDYEYVNYSMSRFSNASDNYDYYAENQGIKDILKSASNIRVGAEYRINNVYLRGGYSYYGSAFKSTEINNNLDYNALSFGIGMRQQNFYFDLAYSALSGTSKYYMYNDSNLQPASIITARNTFVATIGFKF